MKELERNKEPVTAPQAMDPGSMLLDALDRLANAIEAVVDRFGRVMAWLVIAVVFLLFVQNPLREYLGRGQFFANDMGQLSHAAVFMIGVAYAWRWDRQVRMDLFYRNMGLRTKAVVNLLGTVFLLLPWLAFVTWGAVPTVIESARIVERFPETGSPGFFVFKSLLLAFAAMMSLQAAAVIARSIVVIRDPSRSRA
jgi:TRAP-type mannitol/chloroaromatic compound transport system permease small subunit